MTKRILKNLGSSVRQRLLNLAKARKEDFQLTLTYYAVERFLFRLSQSPYKNTFILKGALLFLVWNEYNYRPTQDIDLLGSGNHSLKHLKKVFEEIVVHVVADDGMTYPKETIKVQRIKEAQQYEGARITLKAKLTGASIPMQIDVGFGDIVFPTPQEISYPTLLGFSAPVIKAYPPETVVAEKLQAIVELGIANSRMKDFYDIWILSKQFQFNDIKLSEAIHKTLHHRKTRLSIAALPIAFTPEFYNNSDKQAQWRAFIQKNALLRDEAIEFGTVVNQIKEFVMPLLKSIHREKVIAL